MPFKYARRSSGRNSRRPRMARPRRRTYRKPRYTVRAPRPLGTGAIHSFKQSFEQVIGLNTTAPPSGWSANGNNLYRSLVFKLTDIQQHGEFTDLFAMYKLKGVRMQMYFSNNSAESMETTAGGTTISPNQQMLVWTDRNTGTSAFTGTTDEMLNSQTAKKKLALRTDGRPLDIYMPVRVMNTIEQDSSFVRPAPAPKSTWIGTDYPSVEHYGLNMMIQRVDGQTFTTSINNSQYARIIYTLYFSTKKVA